MPKRSPRSADRDELKADVALMRELGVPLWARPDVGEIRLGPPPAPPPRELTKEEQLAAIEREAQHKIDTLFAASSVRPVVNGSSHRAEVLASVVPRSNAQEHGSGPQKPSA
jgi:hypothetical protein